VVECLALSAGGVLLGSGGRADEAQGHGDGVRAGLDALVLDGEGQWQRGLDGGVVGGRRGGVVVTTGTGLLN